MSSPDKPDDGDRTKPGQPTSGPSTPGQPTPGQPTSGQPTSSQPTRGQPTPGQTEHPFSNSSGESGANVDAFYGVEKQPARARATMQAVDPTLIVESSPPSGSAESRTEPLARPAAPNVVVDSGHLGGPTPPPPTPTAEHPERTILTDGDEPLRPPVELDAELRDAVGAPRRAKKRKVTAPGGRDESGDDDGDDETATTRWSRRTIMITALAIVVGLGIAALVFLGRANSQRYLLTCASDHVSAEQGRAFPPWGSRPMNGAQWKAIPLPASAECRPRETEDVAELEGWYLELLVDRASTTLSSPSLLEGIAAPGAPAVATNGKGQPVTAQNPLDAVAAELDQALLLSRAPERRDQRKEVERLLGDVQYWRASLRLREASAALVDASRQFDAAAAQRPRHVTDAAAWGTFLKKLSDELQAGPNGAPTEPTATPAPNDHPMAPAGVALPVEPTAPAEPSQSDAAPAAPDAGVPSGGVLL